MKKSIFLLVLLFLAILGSNQAYSLELDTVWVSDYNGSVLFYHPVTKNVWIARNGITELYSENGEFVREFPYNMEGIRISPDGTKIVSQIGDSIELYDYNAREVICRLKGFWPRFLGNNTLIYRLVDIPGFPVYTFINKYDISSSEISEFKYDRYFGLPTALEGSPDGKYIVHATSKSNIDTGTDIFLYLIDPETMKQKQLARWETNYNQNSNNDEGDITRIIFSPDSKKCITICRDRYTLPATLFDLENKVIEKVIGKYVSFYFVNDKYYVKNGNFGPNVNFQILEMNTDKVIFENYGRLFNVISDIDKANIFYCNTPDLFTGPFCFDLNNIISGVPRVNPIKVSYNNRKLLITPNDKLINEITIMSVEGREVYRQSFERMNFSNPLEVALDVSNGLYIINITSGKDNYTYKIIVKE